MAKISFDNKQTDFSTTLKKVVEEYFSTRNIKITGNWKLYIKTAIVISAAITNYWILVFVQPEAWISLILCALFGINIAVIGFNVMHDGAHGSYSQKHWLNEIMAYTANMMGASSSMWKIKHNVIHHTYTNIEGQDDDIDIKPFIRTNEHQKVLVSQIPTHLLPTTLLSHMAMVGFSTRFFQIFYWKNSWIQIEKN